jgi:Holliday junction resolvasome RuvABC endonuclease subunit
MRVFALDAVAVRTGWAVLDHTEGSPSVVDYGSLELPEKLSIGERLTLFQKTLRELVQEYKVDVISVEEPYIRFIKSSMTLIKILGAVQHIAYELTGREAVVVAVSTLRAQLGIKTKGEAAKAELATKILDRFGIEEEEYDETDAIGVGWVTPLVIRRKACQKPKRRKRKKKSKKRSSS